MKRTDFRGRHIGIELFATVPAAQAGEEDQGTGPLRSVHHASRKTRIPESRRRLPRSLGWIVDVAHFFPIVLFRQEFHRGLEAIDGTVAMLDRVPSTAALACSPTKRSYPTTWRTIAPFFCEGIALISFLIGPTSGKSDVFLLTVGDHCLIDEFPTVIGINSQDRKREERSYTFEGSQHRLPASMHEGEAFCPSSGSIGERQCIQVSSLDVGTTMGAPVPPPKSRVGSRSTPRTCGSGFVASAACPLWLWRDHPEHGCVGISTGDPPLPHS
jgi:hypothetical protein